MKRIIVIVIIVFLCIGATLFIKPLLLYVAEKSFRNIFTDSSVHIGTCSLKPTCALSFYNIEIKRAQDYDFKVGSIFIHYTLSSLFKKYIPQIEIKEVTVSINLQKRNISQFGNYLNIKSKKFFFIDGLKISDLNIDLKSGNLNLILKGSFGTHLLKPSLDSLDLNIASLKSGDFQLKTASLTVTQDALKKGEFYINNISYDKIKITDIKGNARLNDNVVLISPLYAEVFNGKLRGSATFFLDKTLRYLLNVKAYSIPIDTIIKEFNLSRRINMSGNLNGDIILQGNGVTLSAVKGALNIVEPGGILSINDTNFLNTIAQNTKQSLEMVMENFNNYRYNNGKIDISLEGDNLILKITLEGNQGKRNLSIVLHNVKIGGGYE